MNINKSIWIVFALVGILFTACQKDAALPEDAIVNIPTSTSSVTSFDINSLMEKADFEAVKQMEFYKDLINDAAGNPSIAAVMSNPEKSGVDLNSKAYLTQDTDLADPANSTNSVLLSLKDKDAFKALMTSSSSAAVSSEEGFEFFSPEGNVAIGWNDKLGVIAMSQNSGADLKASLAKIFSTTPETSVANNDNLKTCLAKSSDIVSWFNSEPLAEAAKGDMAMAMMMAGFSPESLKGNYAHSYVNFENGEVVGESSYEFNEDLVKQYKHIFKDEVKTDFSKYIPAQDLVFAVAAAIDGRGINMILDGRGMSGMVNGFLREYGLTVDELTKIFDGDLLVSGYKVEGEYNPMITVATKIGDKDLFQKVIDLGKEYKMISDEGNGVYNMLDAGGRDFGKQPQLYFSGDMLFVGDGASVLGRIKSGDVGQLVGSDVKKVVSGNLMGGFLNFKNLSQLANMNGFDWSAMEDGIMRMDRDDSSFNVKMADGSSNSLKSLIKMANDNYKK